jgi:hypothetical protein
VAVERAVKRPELAKEIGPIKLHAGRLELLVDRLDRRLAVYGARQRPGMVGHPVADDDLRHLEPQAASAAHRCGHAVAIEIA